MVQKTQSRIESIEGTGTYRDKTPAFAGALVAGVIP